MKAADRASIQAFLDQAGEVWKTNDGGAFADCDQTIAGADGEVVLAVHLAALLRRDGDSWRFVDARPYAYAEIPR